MLRLMAETGPQLYYSAQPLHQGREAITRAGEDFVASLNHEVRTPLTGIVGMVDLLLETQLTREQREYVETIRECAAQLLEMLSTALDYAAFRSGQAALEPALFGLPEWLDELAREARAKTEAKGLEFRCRFSGELPEAIVADPIRLRQVVQILIDNAVKFTQTGSVELEVDWQGKELEIRVRDTGPGVAPEEVDQIFRPFHELSRGLARRHQGLGLSLALARQLVELMGGSIGVEATPGQGSCFRVRVPCDSADASASGEEKSQAGQNQPRLLFVDDNEVARRVVQTMLARAGLHVDCVASGAEALAAAQKQQYHLVLMDIQMPAMDGLEATRRLRQIHGYERVPVIALTANCSEQFERECRKEGFVDFIAKPIDRRQLLTTIQRHLS